MSQSLLIDEQDLWFNLDHIIDLKKLLQMQAFTDFDYDTCRSTIELAADVAVKEWYPANGLGDKEQATYDTATGVVKAPPSFHKPWQAFCEAGFPSLPLDAKMGGLGMPETVWKAATQYLIAANPSLSLYSMLTMGACHLLHSYGKDPIVRKMLEKMILGQWGGTMCLTEPTAGSDVGALRTKAVRQEDGTYRISGQKIWISSGDHDLCDNIIHTVLARIEGDPAGTKGISIFAVPKKRINPHGEIIEDNDVKCAGVEHKMGIRGSATCTMQFGDQNDCVGYLLGEERQGMAIMFEMMNPARLEVAVQGLAVSSAAYRHAAQYAQDRIQGQDPADRSGGGVSIIQHPDVKRMLLRLKSYTEAMRTLTHFTTHSMDMVSAGDQEQAAYHQDLLDFLIPIVKATNTDLVWDLTAEAIQIYGGYGFCSEYPMEQMARDSKIFSIYEGTNGIQSLDLLMRKILMQKDMRCFNAFAKFFKSQSQSIGDNELKADLDAKFDKLVDVITMLGGQLQKGEIHQVLAKAVPLQHCIRYLSLGLMQAVAKSKLETDIEIDPGFKKARSRSANYFLDYELGLFDASLKQLRAKGSTISDCEAEDFL